MDRRLAISLIPGPLWGQNLRNALSREEWSRIRDDVLTRQDHQCAICESGIATECHEHWQYDDIARIQRLNRIEGVCKLCHYAIHIRRTRVGSPDAVENVISHYLTVNGCDRDAFEADEKEAVRLFTERSDYFWTVDFGDYSSLVDSE